jgi:hypothetical protein
MHMRFSATSRPLIRGGASSNPAARIPIPIFYDERTLLGLAQHYASPNNIQDFGQTLNFLRWALQTARTDRYSYSTQDQIERLIEQTEADEYDTGLTETLVAYNILVSRQSLGVILRQLERARDDAMTRLGRTKAEEYMRIIRQRIAQR